MKGELDQARDLAKATMLPSLLGRATCKDVYGFKFEAAAHILFMEQKILEKLTTEDEQSFLMISAPPRHGKSMFVLYVAAWYLMMYPSKRVIYVSYNDDFAEQGGQQVRTVIERFGPKLFDVRVSKQTSGKGNWQLDSSPLSGMISVGLGSTITGRGGDCVVGSTLVETPDGPMRVGDVACLDRPLVLSYDEEHDRAVFAEVNASRKSTSSTLVEIRTTGGRTIRCTADHLIWVHGRGYRQAHLLEAGDQLRAVRCLRPADAAELQGEPEDASGVLPRRAGEATGGVHLPHLLEDVRHDDGRCAQANEEATEWRSLLFEGVPGGVPEGQVPVRPADSFTWDEVLLPRMQDGAGSSLEGSGADQVRMVPGGVRTLQQPDEVLLEALLVAASRSADEGAWQLEPPPRSVASGQLSEDATDGESGRRAPLRRLWSDQEARRPSHRQRPFQQRHHESRDALPPGPHAPPQVDTDTVSMVRRLRPEEVDVYDLSVPGPTNFFADGILVHNCIIIDDLIKNAEEAGSRATKARHVREYDGTVRTRLEPGGTIIMISTRWAEDDLPGTIWDRCHTEGYAGDPWEFIEFPALAEISEGDLEEIYAAHGGDLAERVVERWTDEIGRRQGEALWPKRYSRKNLEQIKASMDPFAWGALFQQRPSQRQGGMFPKDAWGYYDPKEMLEVTQRVWVWDTAFTDEGGDWTVGTLWGKFEDGRIGILKHTRFQGDSAKVEAAVKEGAFSVGPVVPIIIEQERAGSGKYLIQSFQKLMPGFNVEGVRPEGTKEERAGPYSAAVINGNVLLPKGAGWIKEWHHEHRVFPRGRHDDQVDTGIYAHRHLTMVGAVTVWSPVGLNLNAEAEMLLLLAQAGISTRQSAGIG